MKRYLVSLMMLMISLAALSYVKVGNLTTEHHTDPINIESKNPRLSWVSTSDEKSVVQESYHILVASSQELLDSDKGDLWDTGTVKSDNSIWIPYEGASLKP